MLGAGCLLQFAACDPNSKAKNKPATENRLTLTSHLRPSKRDREPKVRATSKSPEKIVGTWNQEKVVEGPPVQVRSTSGKNKPVQSVAELNKQLNKLSAIVQDRRLRKQTLGGSATTATKFQNSGIMDALLIYVNRKVYLVTKSGQRPGSWLNLTCSEVGVWGENCAHD